MTFKQMKEIVLAFFPDIGETAVGNIINAACRLFAGETRIYTKSAKIVEYGSTLTYTAQTATQLTALTGKVIIAGSGSTIDSVSLPTDIDNIYRIDFYDSAKKPIDQRAYGMPWMVEHANLWLGTADDTTVKDDIAAIVINYYAIPADMVGDNDSPPFQTHFHHGVVQKAIEMIAANKGNLEMAKGAGFQYREIRREAKIAANLAGDVSQGEVFQHDV